MDNMGNIILHGARVVDPAFGTDTVRDLYIADGKIAASPAPDSRVIDAHGLVAIPGLVDMHVHFRDPGQTHKEDIISGADAAAAGGVTTAVCMPNTKPVIDTPELVQYVLDRGCNSKIRVLPYAAVTVGQLGETLTDFAALKNAGATAFSDDGNPVMSAAVMRRALITARECDTFVATHCEDASLVRNFAVNDGAVSKALGIQGRPAIAEEIMIARDCMLALDTGARLHVCHVSTARSVEIIRRAKSVGARVTCETAPQYFSLTESAVPQLGSLARVNPPLRTPTDVAAIIEGLRDGTIDAIATDHAPHADAEKALGLLDAPSGMIGLETSLALALTHLYHTGAMSLTDIVRRVSATPSDILGLDRGTLSVGSAADIAIFDPDAAWIVAPPFHSRASNTPFIGAELRGRVRYTICRGELVYDL
jgi:dihydroorotase